MSSKRYDSRVKFLLKKLATYSELGVADNAIKATKLVLEEMSVEKGFKRHDGRDYYVHPVAIAQTAIDFGLVKFCSGSNLSRKDIEINEESDALLTVCLLHDILEDVEWIDKEYLEREFGDYIYKLIDNITKRKNENIEDYICRVASEKVSSLVKILDRMNNVSTLSNSSLEHRKRQLKETREYYIPLTKDLRIIYFEDAGFYWQARTIMNSLLNEIERSIRYENKCYEIKNSKQNM